MPEHDTGTSPQLDNPGRRLIMAMLAAGALLLVIAVASAGRTLVSIADRTKAVEHSFAVQSGINLLSAQSEQIETARRGYLISPSRSFEEITRRTTDAFDEARGELQAMVSDNPVQAERMGHVERIERQRNAIISSMFASQAPSIAAIRAGDLNAEPGVQLTRDLRTIFSAMRRTESELLVERNRSQYASLIRFYVVGGLAFILLLGLTVGAIALVMRYNRALDRAQSRLRGVNEVLEDAVASRTAELTRANEEIQRFAYIVSHDLRSPLVNVLGFTAELDRARAVLHGYLARLFLERPELRDPAAWLAVEEDLPEALGFIRTSTEKMDRLINSILELSRQGRRTLRPEALDMTELARSIAATMKQRADAAGASVTVEAIPDLESDRISVEQILANLIENALKYLSPGRVGSVLVKGERRAGMVEVTVSDNGRGIAPADQERIFDLFRRAGPQDQTGEGIGLANVRALTYRLGGRISVESQLGEGSRFTVVLPETFAASEPNG